MELSLGKVQVLIGMIASGKSTYAKNAAAAGAIVINDDALVKAIHADDYTLYSKQLKIIYKTTENHILGMALAMGRLALIDRGLNISKRGRKRWISMAHSFDVPCEALVFNNEGPEVHAKRRSENGRGHPYEYWLRVAEHHNSEWSYPSLDEGFDKIHVITYDDVLAGKVVV